MMVLSHLQVGSKHRIALPFFLIHEHYRIGTERREIFGNEIRNSVGPGPGLYDVEKGSKFVKGKNSPSITMGYKFSFNNINNPEISPGPGSYDVVSDSLSKRSKSYSMGVKFNKKLLTMMNNPGPG